MLCQLESISPRQRTCKINLALAHLYQRTGGNDRSAVTAYKEVLRCIFYQSVRIFSLLIYASPFQCLLCKIFTPPPPIAVSETLCF